MDNKLITRIAFMALGACFGASAAYYVVDKKYSEEVEGIKESCETYKAEMKRYKDEYDTAISTFEDAGVTYELAKEVAALNRKRREEAEKSIETSVAEHPYVSYDKVEKIDGKAIDKIVDAGHTYPIFKEEIPESHLISQEEFCEENGNPKECSTYYEDHHLVVDRTNEEISIGKLDKKILDALGEMGPYTVLYMSIDDVDYEVTYSDEYWKP